VIAHEKTDGTVEYLTATVNGNTVSFKTSSFSLFGVAADKEIDEEPETPVTPGMGDNSNMTLWLWLGGMSLFGMGMTIKSRKRGGKHYKVVK